MPRRLGIGEGEKSPGRARPVHANVPLGLTLRYSSPAQLRHSDYRFPNAPALKGADFAMLAVYPQSESVCRCHWESMLVNRTLR